MCGAHYPTSASAASDIVHSQRQDTGQDGPEDRAHLATPVFLCKASQKESLSSDTEQGTLLEFRRIIPKATLFLFCLRSAPAQLPAPGVKTPPTYPSEIKGWFAQMVAGFEFAISSPERAAFLWRWPFLLAMVVSA